MKKKGVVFWSPPIQQNNLVVLFWGPNFGPQKRTTFLHGNVFFFLSKQNLFDLGRMDEWVGRWDWVRDRDGRMDGLIDARMDGRMVGWIDEWVGRDKMDADGESVREREIVRE